MLKCLFSGLLHSGLYHQLILVTDDQQLPVRCVGAALCGLSHLAFPVHCFFSVCIIALVIPFV